MIGFLRLSVLVAGAGAVWVVAAGQVPSHTRLPISDVVAGAVVTQPFGCTALALEPFDPFCPGRHIHTGIDLAAPPGTPVRSATGGVGSVGFDPAGAGLYVSVVLDSHVRLLYCHLSSTEVTAGAPVTAGEVIGRVGATGRATGPHVHFEVQVDGVSVDPGKWLAAS